ncbi:hypothetical protein ACEZDG_01960 [Streptacidiphilus sp. N1-1]|uniref:Uncharacterized protein n=1 Tax=Streptacidiphilus alkalitolerans TaxID=3342712 RepID=A0ABV6V2U9_9ACTN
MQEMVIAAAHDMSASHFQGHPPDSAASEGWFARLLATAEVPPGAITGVKWLMKIVKTR